MNAVALKHTSWPVHSNLQREKQEKKNSSVVSECNGMVGWSVGPLLVGYMLQQR